MNKVFQIFILLAFCFVINSSEFVTAEPVVSETQTQTTQIDTITDEDFAITEPQENVTNNALNEEIRKQTKHKNNNVFFKFLFSMLWVTISSFFVFLILLAYKKLILKGKTVIPTYESMEHSLDTPKNFKEAIKIFLDKTKWN